MLFKKSWNGQGWKGPLDIMQSNPPAKASSPIARDTRIPAKVGFEHLQRGRLHGQPVMFRQKKYYRKPVDSGDKPESVYLDHQRNLVQLLQHLGTNICLYE